MHTQEQVTQAMIALINELGTDMSIFAEDGEICISVFGDKDEITVERILNTYGLDYLKDDSEWPVTNYTFKGEYDEEDYTNAKSKSVSL